MLNMRLGYLYSRYPVISQTFCDMEMLALERLGWSLEIGSVYSPLTSLRHEHITRLRAPIQYAPPQPILRIWEKKARAGGRWPARLVDLHERKYGAPFKAAQRARNALYFADLFTRNGVEHFHVHFANRAAHTALFVKEMSGLPFSVTAHGQDFMTDLKNDDLLREICAAAEFVAAETDYSCDLLRQRCPDSAAKIHRVYNGMDLEAFPPPVDLTHTFKPRILSVGRLVVFKGFDHLIDACAELTRRGVDFSCEIIGDGPLREQLQRKIDMLNLGSRVALLGSVSQHAVFEKLRAADVFALAAAVDVQGGSDVFPTVILEAMAAARPVVSTQLAGIPESVVHGETGLLVSPGDTAALVNALERLLLDPELRISYGTAGRARIEKHFQVEHTVAPLIQLFQTSGGSVIKSVPITPSERIAYIIDRWPDASLPSLNRELEEMHRRNIQMVPFVCELDTNARFTSAMEDLAQRMEFLPDAMAIEAEWRANGGLAQKLEESRAQDEQRVPADIFLRQARFALVLRKLIARRRISHLHATSSRALVCALLLQQLVRHGESVPRRSDLTVSATIEPHPDLPRDWIKTALQNCVGGRVRDATLREGRTDSFLRDKKTGIHLTRRAKFWQEWAQLLQRWGAKGGTANA
jgi:glycosyltransferase involved in cell wall biosynthesis